MFITKNWRARTVALAVIVTTFFLGVIVTAPPEAQASGADGWCNATTSYSSYYSYWVPTIGVNGSRNCIMASGSYSNGVKALQASLTYCHAMLSGTPDGAYGPLTASAVRTFQSSAGITVDGEYGPQTHNVPWLYWSRDLISNLTYNFPCATDSPA